MKLRNHILLWLVITSVTPLVLLGIVGNHYSQQVFIDSIDADMHAELDRLATKLDELFANQSKLLTTLAESALVQHFAHALAAARQDRPPDSLARKQRALERYFLSLQQLAASDAELRLLDSQGNTVIKASFGQDNPPHLETLLPYAIHEREPGPAMHATLQALPVGEVRHQRLHFAASEDGLPLLPDAILPLQTTNGERSYLVFRQFGRQIDKLLTLAPRPRNAHLLLLEPEPAETPTPRLLFDDETGVRFRNGAFDRSRIDPALLQKLRTASEGTMLARISHRITTAAAQCGALTGVHSVGRLDVVSTPPARPSVANASHRTTLSSLATRPCEKSGLDDKRNQRIYFREYNPFPDRFDSWMIAERLDDDQLLTLFRQVRWRMLGLTGLALILSLTIAWVASRRLARPICQLAHNLRAWAKNAPLSPDLPALSSEVSALQRAFHDMVRINEETQAQKAQSEKKLQQSARLASIGEMAAGIGHELNNPLTNILSLAKLIRHQQQAAGAPTTDTDALLEETQRASRIVRGILDFSRQVEPNITALTLGPWLDDCLSRVQRAATEKGVPLELDPNIDRDLRFNGDPFQLQQVLVNLLTNAIQASPAGQPISIHAFRAEQTLILQVRDRGEGIDPEIENRLFEPFFTTREVGVGNGLGLSISMGIIEVHGGSLALRNNPGGGCTAEIRLPL